MKYEAVKKVEGFRKLSNESYETAESVIRNGSYFGIPGIPSIPSKR